MPEEDKDEENKASVICVDESTLIQLTKRLEKSLLALQEDIKELKRHVKSASGRKRFKKTNE
jgi:hypothetical protein